MSVTSIAARLPRAEDRYLLHKQMIESLPSALLICDAATLVVVEHNASALAFFEEILEAPRAPRGLVGRDLADFVPDFEKTIEPLLQKAAAAGETCFADELRLSVPDGDRFIAVTVQPMSVHRGSRYLMVSLSEVTERVAARQRQEYLERMESVGALAGGLAHDVNNMLFAIGGHAYLLRSRADMSREALGELDQIDAAISRARTLTGKLLTFARGSSPERSPVQINEAVLETLGILSGSLGEEVRVEVSLDPEVPPVLADSGGLQQILMNFCVNARDAMNGRGRLAVRTFFQGGHVVLEVSDTGPGIPQAIRARIFEPFFTTKRERGTGLGLSVVYGLVKNYGGTVAAADAAGGGARFVVRLPACRSV